MQYDPLGLGLYYYARYPYFLFAYTARATGTVPLQPTHDTRQPSRIVPYVWIDDSRYPTRLLPTHK